MNENLNQQTPPPPVVPSQFLVPPMMSIGTTMPLKDWYWVVANDPSNVWSSARAMSVPDTDADYQTWLGYGRTPTYIASQADLEAMFAVQYPAGALRPYNADARYRKASGGVIITSLSPVLFLTDPTSRNTVNSAYQYAATNPAHLTHWKMSDGTFIDLTSAQMTTLNNTMTTFVQSCFTMESTNLTGIGNGSITTIAQIDAAFAGISNVFP